MPYIGNEVGNRFVASKAASVYSGNGSTTAFTLEHAVGSDEDILVSVDGVIQEPSVAYAVSSGTTLTFTAAPSSNSGNNIFVYYLFRTVATVDHPSTSSLQATDGTFSSTLNVTGETTLATHLNLGDNDKIKLGASGDLEIYHNDRVQIQKYTGEDMITCKSDGAVELFYDNAKKFETTSAGVTVSGGVNLSSGNVTVVDGQGLYFGDGSYRIEGKDDGATTARIGFVAGGSEVARFTSNGLTFGGDTAAANALDDYEEGTFTATLYGTTTGSGTNVTTTGSYIKVGSHVTIGAYFQNVNLSSMSGSMNIGGIPFTTNGEASSINTGSVALYGFSFTGFVTLYTGNNSTVIDMLDSRTGQAWAGLSVPQAAGKYMIISLTYKSS